MWFWLGAVAAALVLILGLCSVRSAFSQALRRRMRMGRWPLAEPRSLEEIVALLKSETPPGAAPRRPIGPASRNQRPEVGEGWLYHLSGQPLEQPAIALGAHWSGVVEWSEDAVRVRAGTLWGELIKRLWAARQHLTDGSQPMSDHLKHQDIL